MATTPVFFVAPELLVGRRVTVDGDEGHHAAAVRRLQVGERVDLVDGVGGRVQGVVAEVAKHSMVVDVVDRTTEPTPQPPLVVVQALAKGDRGERAVEALTEVGVDVIVPWAASRSVVEWRGERGDRALQRWRSVAREAAKQSRRSCFPQVAGLSSTSDIGRLITQSALTLVLHEDAERSLSTFDLPAIGDVVLIVGPEGGISPDELASFEAAGGDAARLGPTVLRTSTAGVVAASLVLARTRWSQSG